jgi:hypothetical protein
VLGIALRCRDGPGGWLICSTGSFVFTLIRFPYAYIQGQDRIIGHLLSQLESIGAAPDKAKEGKKCSLAADHRELKWLRTCWLEAVV